MRINKFLAGSGLGSRRKVEELVVSGRITVNSKIIKQLSTNITSSDVVRLDGKKVEFRSKLLYFALNKPIGYVSTNKDPYADKTVMSLFREQTGLFSGFFIVGRLDKLSRGLMLITNDGNFAQRLSHPSGGCEKEYLVRVRVSRGNPVGYKTENLEKVIRYFKCGTLLDGRKTLPAQVRVVGMNRDELSFEIILKEGRKRQIRKIFKKANMQVMDLLRTRIDVIRLNDIAEGSVKRVNLSIDKS